MTTAAPTPLASIEAMLAPRSIAIFGATERAGAPSRRIIETLVKLNYAGEIYPIHPTSEKVLGLKCYPSLAEVPGDIDVAGFTIAANQTPDAVRQAAAKGVKAGIIYGGIRDATEKMSIPQIRAAIVETARGAGMALCGPNCMGVLNPVHRSSMYLGVIMDDSRWAGNVGLVTHSGSVTIGMLGDVRRYGFSHVISSGEESVTTADRYIEALIDDPHTEVIALFLESIRNVAGFTAALDRAQRVGKPVVALKIGRSTLAREAAVGHTGSVAGDGRVYSALMARHGGIEATSLEELAEVVACAQARRRPKGTRVGIITASGGQVEMILDEAEGAGYQLPPLSAAERADAERVIGPISGTGNPLDAWGNGDYSKTLAHGFDVMARKPDIDCVVLVSDTNDGQVMAPTRYTDHFLATSERSDKPFFFMNTRSGLMRMELVEKFKGTGVGMVTGVRQGLGALGRMGRWAQHRPPGPPLAVDTRSADAALAAALDRPRPTINEVDAKVILRALGLKTVDDHIVASAKAAADAADKVGYPVVLKVASDAIPHRSEHGLVSVGLRTREAVAAAFEDHAARVKALDTRGAAVRHVVQPMAAPGVEVIVGVSRDPELGPYLMFGAGGVLVELIEDAVVRPLPLHPGDAGAMVKAAKVARLLEGYRGRPAADAEALVSMLERVAAFAWANRAHILEIDLNPVFVAPSGKGCTIADALIVPRRLE